MNSIVCDGMQDNQSVRLCFESEKTRDSWLRKHCYRYLRTGGCPYAQTLYNTYDKVQPPDDYDIKLVLEENVVYDAISGRVDRVMLPEKKIYEILFDGYELDGTSVYDILIVPSGLSDGVVMACKIIRMIGCYCVLFE